MAVGIFVLRRCRPIFFFRNKGHIPGARTLFSDIFSGLYSQKGTGQKTKEKLSYPPDNTTGQPIAASYLAPA
jgi:hypothetical protein